MPTSAKIKRIPVVFRYPEARPLFFGSEKWHVGGAPLQMYMLAKELAKDPCFDVSFWIDGPIPAKQVDGISMYSFPLPIPLWRAISFLPQATRSAALWIAEVINRRRCRIAARLARDGVMIFSVCSSSELVSHQEMIHKNGGKVFYRVASDIDVVPQMRGEEGDDDFSMALATVDTVIVATHYQRRMAKENFGIDTLLIPSPFLLPFVPDDSKVANEERDTILWVGQCVAYRRPWVMLELARAFPSENFVMVMPECDALLTRAIKSQLSAASNIELIDHVPPDQIQPYFNRAKMYVNTSQFEGFPNTLHQAAFARTPYVSLTWNPDNLLENNNIGLGCNDDVSTMILHMSTLLQDEELMRQMGDNAHQYVTTQHVFEDVVSQYKDAIRKACDGAYIA